MRIESQTPIVVGGWCLDGIEYRCVGWFNALEATEALDGAPVFRFDIEVCGQDSMGNDSWTAIDNNIMTTMAGKLFAASMRSSYLEKGEAP